MRYDNMNSNSVYKLDTHKFRFRYDKRNNVLYINIHDLDGNDVGGWLHVLDISKTQIKKLLPKEIVDIVMFYRDTVSPLVDQDLAMRTIYLDGMFISIDSLVIFVFLVCGRYIWLTSPLDVTLKLLIISQLLLFGRFISNDFNQRVIDIYQSIGNKPDVKAYRIAMYRFNKMIEEVNQGKYDPS